jgi:hypothetical protein
MTSLACSGELEMRSQAMLPRGRQWESNLTGIHRVEADTLAENLPPVRPETRMRQYRGELVLFDFCPSPSVSTLGQLLGDIGDKLPAPSFGRECQCSRKRGLDDSSYVESCVGSRRASPRDRGRLLGFSRKEPSL